MKTQIHNQGDLRDLNVKIEKEVMESFERMSKNSGQPIADLVVIAMKRFRASHSDLDPRPAQNSNKASR